MAFGGFAALLAFLHSVAAQDTESIKERRLRAWYCLGQFNHIIPLAEGAWVCADSPDKAECAESQRKGKVKNEFTRQRLVTYLMATANASNNNDMLAAVQGKLDSEQCQ